MKKVFPLVLILTISMFSLWLPISYAEENSEYYWDYFLIYNFTYSHEVKYLALSGNGTLMAVFLGNSSILIYKNYTLIGKHRAFGDIRVAGFSPSGKMLYFEQEAPRKFVIINLVTNEIQEFEVESKISVVTFTDDEKYVALGGVRESRGSPKNYIYLIDLEKGEILWTRRVVKDVHKILFTEEGKLVSLTTETFCHSCLIAKEKYIKYFNMADGKVLLRVEREKYVEDIFPTDNPRELGVIYTERIVKYKVDFAEHKLKGIKEISTTELGVFRGFSPDGKHLYYEKKGEKRSVIKVLNRDLKIIYSRRIKIYKNGQHRIFPANNFTIIVRYQKSGDPLAKIMIYKLGGLSYQILVKNRYKKIAYSDAADKIIVYSRNSVLVYQYMKKKIEKPEETKYYKLNIVILDYNNNTLDNVNLTIKELGLSIIVNGTWSQVMPVGVYTIIVSKENYIDTMKIINLTSDIHVQIKMKFEIFKLNIKVIDLAERSVADADVMLYKLGGELLAENKTNAEGFCQFNVEKGEYEILVVKGDTITRQMVDVRDNINITIELPIEILKKVKITLVVKGEDGAVLENYTAYFLDENGYIVAVYSPAKNSTDGVELLPGNYLVRIKAEGYKGETVEVEAFEEKSYTVTLEKEKVSGKEGVDYTPYILVAVAAVIAAGVGVFLKKRRVVKKEK